MFTTFLFVSLILVGIIQCKFQQGLRAPPISREPLPEEKWLTQRLDHFRPTESRTWKQRYWINWKHYKPGGPALLMIGGEGEANPAWMEAGSWLKYAEDEGAAMLLLEHRYYGKSHPTPDLGVKNLVWLSSRQALADLAAFTIQMRETNNLTGPWVSLGGSYPGSLAAWYRLKYPHLVAGSVSTSAPLLAKADFFEYLEVVEASLDTTVPGCVNVIKEAIRKTQFLTAHRVGWQMLKKRYNLCSNFDGTNANDVTNFFESLIGNFEGIVQYNKDNKAFEGATWMNVTIETVCNIMTDEKGGSEIERLARVNDLSLTMAGEKCLDHTYDSEVKSLQDNSWDSDAAKGGRQWTYQTCTEFGWYQSSDIPGNPWHGIIPVKFFEKMCSDIYGPKFTMELLEKGIQETNSEYGGLNLKVNNVVFVQGSIDPWHAMGITKDVSAKSPAIFIEGTAHCANMYPAGKDDSEQLKNARIQIGRLVKKWIDEANQQNHP
eukprot:GFUD01030416.1.p1 GENE.GFUD01030416.1~~GFUD01030416.1.p1  ORF type:complete len:490 (+),score=98.51 GFUD01030416.1:89-1558(+)